MSLFQTFRDFKKVAFVSVCTLVFMAVGTSESPGQTGGFTGGREFTAGGGVINERNGAQAVQQPAGRSQPVVLRPVDTGRKVVTFNLGRSKPDLNRFAVKTNLLYGAATLTPNLSLEVATGGHTSIELTVGYNKWGNLWDFSEAGPEWDPTNAYKRKLDHIFGKAEFRYWLRGSFEGHFFGAYGLWADYQTGELGLKPVFQKRLDYDGHLYGGGLSYGYLWKWNRRCGLELSVGAGVVGTKYDERKIEVEQGEYKKLDAVKYQKTYLGPTSIGAKFVLMIL